MPFHDFDVNAVGTLNLFGRTARQFVPKRRSFHVHQQVQRADGVTSKSWNGIPPPPNRAKAGRPCG